MDRAAIVVGLVVFALATVLYLTSMATSFTAGDSANYLNLGNTGGLTDRGNGLPLYVSLLNFAVHVPLPVALSDGVRCNVFTVLLTSLTVLMVYVLALSATRSIIAAIAASLVVMVSGLVWASSTWIMPHITLALVSAWFWILLLAVDSSRTSSRIAGLGLVGGLGFGLMPNTLLFLPAAALYLVLVTHGRERSRTLMILGLGAAAGILVNVALMALHESMSPTLARQGTSVIEAVRFYVLGGDETSWFMANVSPGHFARGLARLPLDIAADFELVGSLLAVLGLFTALRAQPRLHLSLLFAIGLIALWVGTYPGDTRSLHGLSAYPIAALWLAHGVRWVVQFAIAQLRGLGLDAGGAAARRAGVGSVVVLGILAGVVVGKLTYRDSLCALDPWMFQGFCRERIPESIGDHYLVRAERALEEIPDGALVFGAAWDAKNQLNYFIEVHGTRADLRGPHDLTKFDAARFAELVEPQWAQKLPVYVFGEWQDIELWSKELLPRFEARAHGDFVFELRPPKRGSDPTPSDSTERPGAGLSAATQER